VLKVRAAREARVGAIVRTLAMMDRTSAEGVADGMRWCPVEGTAVAGIFRVMNLTHFVIYLVRLGRLGFESKV
jgi:hypothetical protein